MKGEKIEELNELIQSYETYLAEEEEITRKTTEKLETQIGEILAVEKKVRLMGN